jgi:iron complex transport system substrate-binding protein
MRRIGANLAGLLMPTAVLLGAAGLCGWAAHARGASPLGAGGAEPPAHPRRIVSTNLSTDEVLLALVPPERILALSRFADDPTVSNVVHEARAVRHRVRGEAEPILALGPDLVFAFPFGQRDVQALLRQAGVPLVQVPGAHDLEAVKANVRRIGAITGARDSAEAVIADMDRTLDGVRQRVAGVTPPRVLFWYTGGTTSGTGTLIDELMRLAGGRNVAAEAGFHGVATLPLETALELEPDVVFVLDYRADERARKLGGHRALAEHPVWRTLAAVREGRVHVLPTRFAYASSHHAARAAVDMARRLHPDRFGEGVD